MNLNRNKTCFSLIQKINKIFYYLKVIELQLTFFNYTMNNSYSIKLKN